MMKNCPICYEKIYSELGNGCKMCGMVLKDKGRDFCSKVCRKKFSVSRKIGVFTSFIFILLISMNPVLAHSGEDSLGHHSMMGFGIYGMGTFLWLIVLLIIIVLVLLTYWMIREISKK